MTQILHTSDAHLAVDSPERLHALRDVLGLAHKQDVDLLTIGGDLFDSSEDAEQLRPDLREEFSDRGYRILSIPGNHDAEAYRGDLHFGTDFEALLDSPFSVVQEDDVRIVALPFTPSLTTDIRLALRNREGYDGPELLLFHGSLEAPFEERYAGDEEARYCPVTKTGVDSLGFDYVLGGHFHNVHKVRLPSGGIFVYPGSPASVARNETGPRVAVLVDTDEATVEMLQLPTFHFDRLKLTVVPGQEEETLERIEAWLAEREGREVEAAVLVEGHTEWSEQMFQDSLEESTGALHATNRTRSVDRVLAHPLYQDFVERIEESVDDEDLQKAARQRVLEIFSKLFAQNQIQ